MVYVKFTFPDTFMEEIEKDLPQVDRSIVRFTTLIRPTDKDGVSHLLAVATARVQSNILCMEYCCGNLYGNTDELEVGQKAGKVGKDIEENCKQLGLEFRSGRLEIA